MYAFRQAELVGKRFLCVREKNTLRPNSRSRRVANPLDYQWKVGVIRVCSEKDFNHPELKVLVEYDDEEWTTREWLKIHDGSWRLFLVEKSMVWSQRPDPSNPKRPLLWPALTFVPLVDKHGLSDEERPVPVEFVGDHERAFLRSDEFRPYGQDDDALHPVLRNNVAVVRELQGWQLLQKSQSILMKGPFTLTGFRVKVYRQSCRQWFSAVITAHDIVSRELSVMDDTVLQTHRVDPTLVQVILLANEAELDSLLRGELNVVRVLPMRQHRHSQVVITAPLTTHSTSGSLSSSPSTWQLYSGLSQDNNTNNLANITTPVYQSALASTSARLNTACSSSNSHGIRHGKERRKSTETRNRTPSACKITRSNSNSPVPSNDTLKPASQTPQSSFTSSVATPLMSNHLTAPHSHNQLSNKTSPPDATISPAKNSSSSSSVGSPPSSFPKKSPLKQQMSPKTSPPSVLSYNSSPASNASMSAMGSPFRAHPFCSSPDLSSVASMASPMAGISHMGMCSPGHAAHSRSQGPHPLYPHTMGLNISPNQLYALQCQQQQQMPAQEQQEYLTKLRHQHYQSLLQQYQMHCYQLQLMVQQQELIQQMPLTAEQQHILAEHYNQLLYQFQCAQIFQQLAAVTQEEQLSNFHSVEGDIHSLPERIQQRLREAQQQQKQWLQELTPRLEPKQLHTLFTCLQQKSMTAKEIEQLYSLLLQQQQEQKRLTHAQRETPECEQQKQKLQQCHQQYQEHLQKFLQLPKSPSSTQVVETKQEPKQEPKPEASCSSSSPSRNASPSTLSPSPSSSTFTVHHLPSVKEKASSPKGISEDKSENEPSAGVSSSESPKLTESKNVEEIELTSTTTTGDGQSLLEKLLQHHLKAVENNRKESSTKTKKSKVEEKRSKRRRRSTESKDDSLAQRDSEMIKCSPSVSFSSEGDSTNVISSSLTVGDGPNSSSNKLSLEKREEVLNNKNFHKNSSFGEVDNNHGKEGSGMAVAIKEGDKTASKTEGETFTPEKERNSVKSKPNEQSADTRKGVFYEDAAPWIPDEATHDVPQTVRLSSNVTESIESFTGARKDFKKESSTVLDGRGSGEMFVNDTTSKNPNIVTLEGGKMVAQGRNDPIVPKVSSTNDKKEMIQGTTVKISKKGSTKSPSKDSSNVQSLSSSCNSATDLGTPSVNVKDRKDSERMDVESKEIDTSVAKQKPSLSSEVTPLFTKSFLSMSSSNSADHNGELFSGEGLKTYLRKVTPNKRKLGTEDNFVEDNSIAKKALTMGNKESPETDRLKDIIPNNSKVELAKRLNKKFANSHLEEKTVQSQHQLSVSSSERTKASRKNSADANNVLTKRSRREEIMSSDVDDARHKTDVKLQLKDNITREEDKNRVDSVSFVADQVVNEISINHSPTAKDAPGDQFGAVKVNSERQNSRSKERIREITSKKKELKSREEKNKERQQRGVGLPSVCVKEPDTADSLETVVDSVLDEEIALIYKADEEQDNESLLATSETDAIVKTEERPVTPVKEKEKEKGKGVTVSSGKEPAPPRGRGRPRKKEVKKIVDESDSTSPSSEQYFLQDRICASLPDLPKCRDCREHPSQRNGLDCCRFNSFRRLRKKKNGTILSAGFQLPEDAAAEDFLPWVAQDKVDRLDKKTSLYILYNIGDQFCSVMQEEKKAITCVETDGKQVTVAYKRAVQGVREMCDVCATTIFNVHWVCHRCGFGVCLDCYKLRVQERERQSGLAGKRVFEFKWVMCCPGICHQPKFLSVAQIIPKTVLSDLGDELHRAREVWKISKRCPCKEIDDDDDDEDNDDATETGLSNEELTQVEENGVDACKETSDTIVKTEPLSISSSQTAGAGDSESSFEDDVNLICDESLGIDSPADQEQEWLTEEKRRNHFYKKAGFGLVEAKPQKAKKVSSGLSLLMDYSSSREVSPCDSPVKDVKPAAGMFNFSLGGNGGSFSGLDLLALACERNGEDFSMDNTFRLNAESKTEMDTTNFNPLNKRDDNRTTDVPGSVATTCESTSAEYSEEVRSHAVAPVLDSPEAVPHSWLCDGRLLRLHDPRHPGNLNAFEARWKKGEPVLVSQVDKYLNLDIWTPKAFGEEFGSEISDVVNCRNGVVVERFKVGDFWQGFESIKDRPLDSNGEPMLLKLKDWPPKDDFSEKLPTRFEDLMNNVPLPEYTRRDGSRNLVSRLPDFFVKPDLGPKMYNAYGSAACPKEGTTNLHLDMSDAVNIMVYVGVPKDEGAGDKERQDAIRAVDEACDESQRTRVRNETARIGALWHIYAAEDADKIRDCLRAVAKERKMKYSAHHDPIHDQCFYLDHEIRQRLKGEYGVEGWAICQCLGDSVFIPAGAPHQVRNLYSCVKVAEDFVSPERIDHCFRMTQEFRHLSDKHTNHEDKLQVKNIIFHAVKDALHSLKYHEQESTDKTQNSSDGIH